jgi:Haem-binding domain
VKRLLQRTGLALLGLGILIQFVPTNRSNPPVTGPIDAPLDVQAVLRRSCYDCHSNETRWPWYSRIAPVSWLVARDVREGRAALNFSTWAMLDWRAQADAKRKCDEETREGEMPPWFYTPLHPGARVASADLAVLRRWAGSGTETLGERGDFD